MDRPKTIFKGRSRCDFCHRNLRWFELVPIFSYFLQGGKCRRCGKELSIKYPVLEFATGILTWLVFLDFKALHSYSYAISIWVFWSLLLVLTVEDLKTRSFPSWLVYMLFGAGIASALLKFAAMIGISTTLAENLLRDSGYGILAGMVLPAILITITKGRGMGDGDLFVGAALGALLAPFGIFVMYVIAFISGGLVAGALLLLGQAHRKSQIAFVPFMAIAGVVSYYLILLNPKLALLRLFG